MVESPDKDGFLSRWSRRKVENETPREPETPVVDEAETEVDDERLRQAEENRVAAEEVDISQLSFQDDFTIFLKEGVPRAVRNRAMRHLWASNPVLANLDGLNDYEGDFANPKDNLAVFKSAWKVGSGYAGMVVEEPLPRMTEAPDEDEDAADVALEDDGPALDDQTQQASMEPDDAQVAEDRKSDNEPGDNPSQEVSRVSLRKRLAMD